jgi:hypothetical protein
MRQTRTLPPVFIGDDAVSATLAATVIPLSVGGNFHYLTIGAFLSGLKEWQTLMGAMVALLAAGLAYVSAMSKVWSDRKSAEEADFRRRVGLLSQLKFVSQDLGEKASETQNRWKAAEAMANHLPGYYWLEFEMPKELVTAWDNLDIFTQDASIAINGVRWSLARYNMMMESVKQAEGAELGLFRTEADALLANVVEGAGLLNHQIATELEGLLRKK